jgi:hypothetical protein
MIFVEFCILVKVYTYLINNIPKEEIHKDLHKSIHNNMYYYIYNQLSLIDGNAFVVV